MVRDENVRSLKMEVRNHETWLDEYKSGSRIQAVRAWTFWIRYMEDKNEDWILKNLNTEDWGTHLVNFRRWLEKQPKQRGGGTLSDNTTKSLAALIRGYFVHLGAPLRLSRKQRRELTKVESLAIRDFPFNINTKEGLMRVANEIEDYIVCAGISFGLRVGDFIKFNRGQLEPLLNQEPPIPIGEVGTKKRGVKAYPFIDRDAKEAIQKLLQVMDREGRTDADELMLKLGAKNKGNEVNRILKNLFRKADIPTGNFVIRFHILRKFVTDQLASVCSSDKWKWFVGKKSTSPYVSREGREAYREVMKFTCIDHENIALPKDIQKLQEQMAELRGDLDSVMLGATQTREAFELFRKKMNLPIEEEAKLFYRAGLRWFFDWRKGKIRNINDILSEEERKAIDQEIFKT